MAILEEHYQISEQIPSKVGVHWKILHVSVFLIIIVCGFMACFSFHDLLNDFNNLCILTPVIVFSNTSFIYPELQLYFVDERLNKSALGPNVSELRAISLHTTQWGNMEDCNFVEYTPLTSTLFAIIWAIFFMVLSKGGSGYASDILPNPWRIVFPCLIFSIIFSIVLLSSNAMLSYGVNDFCSQFSSEINKTKCGPDIDQWTIQFKSVKKPFFEHHNLAKSAAYLGLFGWLLQVALLILRIVTFTDFKIEFVQIRDKEEEIQKAIKDEQV